MKMRKIHNGKQQITLAKYRIEEEEQQQTNEGTINVLEKSFAIREM